MSVTATSGAGSSTNAVTQTVNPSNTLGQDAFLKLLTTELRYQDPTNAMDDKDFIAQLAQFSSLEQIQKMGEGMTSLSQSMGNGLTNLSQAGAASQAIALIGKTITYVESGSDKPLTGKVDSVQFINGTPTLMVGDKKVDLQNVASVK